jgi:cyclopropane fatty-acyl-phospholipid synthase-like methyltransferase
MNYSLNRNDFIAKKLGTLKGDKLLDLGCRDMILSKYLIGKFNYIGVDFFSDLKKKNFINYNLEQGLPLIKNVNIITAVDVLEHLENIHFLFKELFLLSNNKIVVALPNCGYYKFRFKFFFSGELGSKYQFPQKKIGDRHRWITNYDSINHFVKANCPNTWQISQYDFIAQRKNFHLFYFLEKFLSKFFPYLFVSEIIFIFEKK